MPIFEDILKRLPPEIQPMAKTAWESLPAGDRNSFLTLLRGLPTDTNLIRPLLSQAAAQWKLAFGDKQRLAIVGPANVGKSTLYNRLIMNKKDAAAVSPVPGTTRNSQQADAGLFEVVDTPGADMAGETGERERRLAFEAARQADLLVIVFDAVQGVKQAEIDLFHNLSALGLPYVVTLNKIDLARRDAKAVLAQAAQALGLSPEQVVPIAAKDGKNLNALLVAIALIEPRLVAAMGRAMPEFRWQLAWRAIASAASVAAGIALTPLPVVDFAPLIITQSVMVLGIARVYDYKMTLGRARELIGAFGIGLLGRLLFEQLSKLGGIPGWVLSSAIAASTTIVMGYAAVVWFERGERLSGDTISKLSRSLTTYLLDRLRGIFKRKPDKASLRDTINRALDESGLGQDRSSLDQSI